MEFEEVTELVPGTKYLILCHDILKFKGFYSCTEYEMCTFHTVQGEHFHNELQFSQVCNTFYLPKFQRDRIQSDMEHRAVNLILKNITGDPTFTWAEPTA